MHTRGGNTKALRLFFLFPCQSSVVATAEPIHKSIACSENRTKAWPMFVSSPERLLFGTENRKMQRDVVGPSKPRPDSESGRKRKYRAPQFAKLSPEKAKA